MIDRDSGEYELLAQAAAQVVAAQVPGLTCEIGVRTGGGTQVILTELARSPSYAYTHLGIDPWGTLNYDTSDAHLYVDTIYTDKMRRQACADLYTYANEVGVDMQIVVMTDREFFRRFETGVYVYRAGHSEPVNQYALVHFDGPHYTPVLLDEVRFFGPRAPRGARWVLDDYRWYDATAVQAEAARYGFSLDTQGDIKLVLRRDG